MKQEINIPKLGSEMKTGQILKWLVNVGDQVEEDQEICEIKTEKMNAMVESLYDGVITEITGKVGETYNVGEVIGYIEEEE
ncbi:MAG: hypothetical protein HFG80_12475 [Eubacterium sp.]|jgi:pyruvate/2-oxoglutarate dehydrogenase complex dihydrolipoamide acyltransferase (E2) component|nr:hypothetical protein [Eubacterium sp.]